MALAGLLAAAAASGCLGATSGDGSFHAEGSQPMLMPAAGPFDGSGVKALQGTMLVHTFDKTNAGYVDVNLTMPDGKRLSVHWTTFKEQANASWQDGGIASGVVEHGASGHGNKMEPQVDLISGGWGTATATMDGEPFVDPVSGSATWNAHYMVTKEAIMDPTTHAVYANAGKSEVFTPASPGEGYVLPGHTELHFGLWTAGAFKDGYFQAAPEASKTKLADTATGPQYDKTWDLMVPANAKLALVPAITGGAGKLNFTLKDPSGKVLAGADITPVQAGSITLPDAPLPAGDYKLEVSGAGVEAAYEVGVTIAPPAPEWIHVVFENVALGG